MNAVALRPLSLLFVTVDVRGGLVDDAVDIASALRERGHDVVFAATTAASARIRAAGFGVTGAGDRRRDRGGALDRWLRVHPVDAVHVFGEGALWPVTRVARRLRTPVYWTVGDQAPPWPPPAGVVIAYSPHVARRIAAHRHLRAEQVVVEPGRIAAPRVLRLDPPAGGQGRGVPAGPRVLAVTWPASPAMTVALAQASAAVTRLRREGHDVALVHAGEAGSGAPRPPLRLRPWAPPPALVPPALATMARDDLLATAVAVLGCGRGVYAGMLADRPTLVLGRNGYAGACTAAGADVLAAYGFTGANVRRRDDTAQVARLVAALRPLLTGTADGREWLDGEWVRAHASATAAARTYEQLYLRRRRPVEGGVPALARHEAARLVVRSARAVRTWVSGRRPVPGQYGPRPPVVAGTRPPAVVHAFAGRVQPETHDRVAAALRLHDHGWPAVMVLPAAGEWNRIAAGCAGAGVRVHRMVTPPAGEPTVTREAAALWSGVRLERALHRRLDQWAAGAVHAHDDTAVLVWAPAARAAGVPLLWDADLSRRPAPLDRLRFAAAAYLVVTGSGRRLRIGQRLAPYHRRDPVAADEVGALARALVQLTGRGPAPATRDAADGAAAHATTGVDAVR